MDRMIVRVISGPFLGIEGELVPCPTAGMVTVRTATTAYTWREGTVRADAVAPIAVGGRLRCRTAWEHHDAGEDEKTMFWVDRVDLPDDDLAAEWNAYLAHAAVVEARTARRTTEALARFDRDLAPLAEAEAAERMLADEEYWQPSWAADERHAPLRERAMPDDMTDEERLELAIAGLVRRHPSVWDLAEERREAARAAAQRRLPVPPVAGAG